MVRKAIFMMIIILSFFNIFILISSNNRPVSTNYFLNQTQFVSLSQTPAIIDEINALNEKITSFSCEDMQVKVWEGNLSAKIKGQIYYEKPRNFRFLLKSILGKELDMGSNKEKFWYWSRRDKEPGLHFSSYENIGRTRIKPSFNPVGMLDSLGFSKIEINNNMKFSESKDILTIQEKKCNSSNRENIYNCIVINKQMKKIVAFYLRDMSGNLIGSSEIKYKNGLPIEIAYQSPVEKTAMVLTLQNAVVNGSISSQNWQMPDYRPKIDMSKD